MRKNAFLIIQSYVRGVDMSVREETERNEKLFLSEYACLSEKTRGRKVSEVPCSIRTEFQRDRDRIIHCNAFRRLKHKTQVFLSPVSDHYRTRLTHTLEVSQIARTIARALRLNEDLTEAIALGHDLGHTPFGHDGERVLNKLIDGGFRHYEQSVRVVEIIEREGNGLNLTDEVIDGIKNHTTKGKPYTLEGQIVRYSDKIAYINHDIEDAIRGNVISESDLPSAPVKVLGRTKSERITTLVTSIIENSSDSICMDGEVQSAHDELRKFMFDRVYLSDKIQHEKDKANYIVNFLFTYYHKGIEKMPPLYIEFAEKYGKTRAVCDFISGMSDDYAVNLFKEICIPNSWQGIKF